MGHYIEIPTSCVCLQIGVGICVVHAADAVGTGKVNCYNCIVRLHSIPIYRDTIDQGSYHSLTTPDIAGWKTLSG